MPQTVREFVTDSYQLISASSPTVPLHGDDVGRGVQYLNELLQNYAGTGLLLPLTQEVTFALAVGASTVTFADATVVPAADVQQGRLTAVDSAWLVLNDVTYPLINITGSEFNESYKLSTLQSLSKYYIVDFGVATTTMRLYPAVGDTYTLHVVGKFEYSEVTQNDNMSFVPLYYIDFLRLALARKICLYKGRAEAWSEMLETQYQESVARIMAISPVNTDINPDSGETQLAAAAAVRAGV